MCLESGSEVRGVSESGPEVRDVSESGPEVKGVSSPCFVWSLD